MLERRPSGRRFCSPKGELLVKALRRMVRL